jgi:DNA-binding NtrC family response regulator
LNRGKLLLVDDDRHLLQSTAQWLRQQGYAVTEAPSVASAVAELQSHDFDLALVDVRLEDGEGFEVLSHCRQHAPRTSVILMTGYGSLEIGIEALRAGADDLLRKPLLDDELAQTLQRVRWPDQLQQVTRQLTQQLDDRMEPAPIVGRDPRIDQIFDVIQRVADTRATILITGENGTGKSLLARDVHRRSSRREQPFVEVACGAMPENLLESELFGHVAGAFTGATAERRGKFAQADGGTIFLDEIGTASPGLQVKLLRVLQDFEFEPVGGNTTLHVNTRVILATNENLEDLVADGTFRQDLYYRVNVIHIELPPLRERVGDIPLLAEHFLRHACADVGVEPKEFRQDAIEMLQHYTWPGNVRELQNVVERAVLLGRGSLITPADFPSSLTSENYRSVAAPPRGKLKFALASPERQIILDELEANNWNRIVTAERLGINRTTLYKKMKRLGLSDPRQATRCTATAQ